MGVLQRAASLRRESHTSASSPSPAAQTTTGPAALIDGDSRRHRVTRCRRQGLGIGPSTAVPVRRVERVARSRRGRLSSHPDHPCPLAGRGGGGMVILPASAGRSPCCAATIQIPNVGPRGGCRYVVGASRHQQQAASRRHQRRGSVVAGAGRGQRRAERPRRVPMPLHADRLPGALSRPFLESALMATAGRSPSTDGDPELDCSGGRPSATTWASPLACEARSPPTASARATTKRSLFTVGYVAPCGEGTSAGGKPATMNS